MFSGQFYEKRLSVREWNMKLLLQTVAYIAIKVRVTYIVIIERVVCIMFCKIPQNCHPHICCRNCHLHVCAARISNFMIATETVTWIIVTERSNSIPVTEVLAHNLHKCNRRCHLHNCHRKCQLYSSNRNCHL